ncbi:MAG: AraC family transcriptional regulator [Candidatus Ratteibacteria bacterium]
MKESLEELIFSSRDTLPAKVSWSKRSTWTKTRLLWHTEWEFHLIKQGKGAYFIKDRRHNFSANSLILIASREMHNCIPHPNTRIDKGSLFLKDGMVYALVGKTFSSLNNNRAFRLNEKESTQVEFLFEKIVHEQKHQEHLWQEIVKSTLTTFLFMAARFNQRIAPLPDENRLDQKVLEYIERSFSSSIPLATIARDCSCSMASLFTSLKHSTGLTPKQYILQRRIIEAKKILLEEPQKKVSAIASQVGFSDFALFNRSFKNFTGISPSAYRKISHQNNNNYY